MPARERIAINLHEMMCKHNHTDGCDFHYGVTDGVHEWVKNHGHKKWLKKGVRLSDFLDDTGITEEQLYEIVHLTTKY